MAPVCLVIIKGGHCGAGAASTCEQTGVSFMLKCVHGGVGAALRCELTDKSMQEMIRGLRGLKEIKKRRKKRQDPESLKSREPW